MTDSSIRTMWFRSLVLGCLVAISAPLFAQHGRGGGGGHGGGHGGAGGNHMGGGTGGHMGGGHSGGGGSQWGSNGSPGGNFSDRDHHNYGGKYSSGYGVYGGSRYGIYLGGVYGSGQFGNYPYGGYAGYGYGYGASFDYAPYGYYGNGLNSETYYYRSGPQVLINPGYAPGFYYSNPQQYGSEPGLGYRAGIPTPALPYPMTTGQGTYPPMTTNYPQQTLPANQGTPAGPVGTNDLVPGMVLPDGSIVVSVDPIPPAQNHDKNLPQPNPAPNAVPQPPPSTNGSTSK